MPYLGTVVFEGESGRRYEFQLYTLDSPMPAAGAVYGICSSSQKPDRTGYTVTPLYFGQTGDLSERFEGHHRQPCFTRNNANSIAIHLDGDERSRLAKETDLIRRWDPVCNRQ